MHTYLIRYGIMGHVGRFLPHPGCDTPFQRGQVVVVHSPRGVELGEILFAGVDQSGVRHGSSDGPNLADERRELDSEQGIEEPEVLRVAGAADLSQARSAAASRASRFALCQSILERADWLWQLLDVEPLLDGRSIVLHYLGPHRLDASLWRARFRAECDLDVVLEPVGLDINDDMTGMTEENEDEGAHHGCGNCDCGDREDGRTQSDAAGFLPDDAEQQAHGCGSEPHAGCASCGISEMLAARRR